MDNAKRAFILESTCPAAEFTVEQRKQRRALALLSCAQRIALFVNPIPVAIIAILARVAMVRQDTTQDLARTRTFVRHAQPIAARVNLTLMVSIAILARKAMVRQDTTQDPTRSWRFVRHVRAIAQSVVDRHAVRVATNMQRDNARHAVVDRLATKRAGTCA